jgi:hypothetical protein
LSLRLFIILPDGLSQREREKKNPSSGYKIEQVLWNNHIKENEMGGHVAHTGQK